MGWRTLAAARDAGTAVCAAFNTAYFLRRLHDERRRLVAIGVLAVVSFGALREATALIALATSPGAQPALGSASWMALRLAPGAGAAGISALIARRIASRHHEESPAEFYARSLTEAERERCPPPARSRTCERRSPRYSRQGKRRP